MAELTPSERLQPSLLDRLTDEERSSRVEGRDKRVMSMKQLRAAVLRDLSWLLNTSAAPAGDPVYEHPLAAASVVNFGMPDATGLSSSGLSLGEMENRIRQAVERFEPRVIARTLSVRAELREGQRSPSVVSFEISGEFCPLPMPETLYVKTDMDLETGGFDLSNSM